ncbi:MAG: caspase family protein, partial [Magnetococcus sp. DMHC-6]
ADTKGWSLSGTDAALFNINASGLVTFLQTPNFESPTDSNTDNIYNIIVTVTDAGSLTASQAVAITVTNVNEAPTGNLLITGTPTQGQTLTATQTLADADGLGVIFYQWQENGINILGATDSTFLLTEKQVDKTITVIVTYTDGHGTLESVSSPTTFTVANLNDAPTGTLLITGTPTQGQTLTAIQELTDDDGLGVISYQWQENGINMSGATSNTYLLTEAQVGKAITVIATYIDGHGTQESISSSTSPIIANLNDAPIGRLFITGTPTQGQTLTVTQTLDDADGLGIIHYQWQENGVNVSGATTNTYLLSEAQVGKTITVVATYTDGHGTVETSTSLATSAVANINDTPTGNITIAGTTTRGQTLTVSNTIADVDGLGTITYQWQANGSNINGANGNSYILTESEAGKTITVVATYTDGHGTQESVSSRATSTVINPTVITPLPVIVPTVETIIGENLTQTQSNTTIPTTTYSEPISTQKDTPQEVAPITSFSDSTGSTTNSVDTSSFISQTNTSGAAQVETANLIDAMNQSGLSHAEQQAVFAEVGSQNLVAGLSNSSNPTEKQVGAILESVIGGSNINQGQITQLLNSLNLDQQAKNTYLLAYLQVQKEARTQMFSSALASLDDANIVNPFDNLQPIGKELDWFPQITSDKVALLIGIDQYEDPIPSLRTPVKDVSSIADILQGKGFQTIILKNPDQKTLIQALRALGTKMTESQNLMIYYAGHGYLKESTQTGYWLPGDARVDSSRQWLSTKHISDFLSKIKSKNIMLVSDSCFSGSLTKEYKYTSDSVGQSIKEIENKRSVMVMSSGGEEPVLDGGGDGHSVFARSLISILDKSQTDRIGFDLFRQVKTAVVAASPQTPQYGAMLSAGHQIGGDFILKTSHTPPQTESEKSLE